MTLVRDGWIDGRGYYVLRDEHGTPLKYQCEACDGEMEPDPGVFSAHNCENYRDRGGGSIDATDAAVALAGDEGVALSEVTGTGQEGRITKSDVEEYLNA